MMNGKIYPVVHGMEEGPIMEKMAPFLFYLFVAVAARGRKVIEKNLCVCVTRFRSLFGGNDKS